MSIESIPSGTSEVAALMEDEDEFDRNCTNTNESHKHPNRPHRRKLVVNASLIASGGRLVPFRPVVDDYGIDVLLYDETTGRALPLQVKARSKTLKRSGCEEWGDVVHFEVREVALRNKGITRLLAVLLNLEMTTITAAWLMPLPEGEHTGSKRNQKFVIRLSRSENSHDKFRVYFLPSMLALVMKLLTELEQLDRTVGRCGIIPVLPAKNFMLTGEIRSQIDQIWNAFWSGGKVHSRNVLAWAESAR